MVALLSPQLRIREIDQSEYIPQIAGARFGVVGVARKGPVNELTILTSEPELISTFGNPFTTYFGVHAGIQFLRRGSQLLFIRISDGTHATASVAILDSGSTTTLTFSALSPGTWGNTISVIIAAASSGIATEFNVQVLDGTTVVEEYRNVRNGLSNVLDARYVTTLINGISAYVSVVDNNPSGETQPATGTSVLLGGLDGTASLTGSDYVGLETPNLTGMKIFRDVQEVDVDVIAVPGVTDTAVLMELQSICEDRQDCIGLIDPPDNLSFTGIVDWHNGVSGSGNTLILNSSYLALYWPWIQINDTFNSQEVWVPPSGFAAAAMALTDDSAEPWFAPAGETRGRLFEALKTRTKLTQGQQDFIYSGGNTVNPIRTFSGRGTFINGNRTTQRAATALDRIHVRRGLLYLEKGITSISRQFLFEPNDPVTWRRWKALVDPFLANAQSRRGLERYRIIIDETTNPAAQRQQQIMAAKIILIFTTVAESILLDFILKPNGATFNEAVVTG